MRCLCQVLLFAAAVSLAGNACADVLFWLVDQTQEPEDSRIEFQYAGMVSRTGNDIVAYEGADGGMFFQSLPGGLKTDKQYADLSARGDADSFYFELYDRDYNLLATSGSYKFSDVLMSIYDERRPETLSSVVPVTVSAFHTVPEPTGGLLMLAGVALLALKRRNS